MGMCLIDGLNEMNGSLIQRRNTLVAKIIRAAGALITDDESNTPVPAETYAMLVDANRPAYVNAALLLSIEYGNIEGIGYLPTSVVARYPREQGGMKRRRFAFEIDKDVYDSKKVHGLYKELMALEGEIAENLARWLTGLGASVDCLSNFSRTKTPDIRSMGAVSANDYAGYVTLDPEGIAENAIITYTWEATMAGWLVAKVNIDIPAPENKPVGKNHTYEFAFDLTIPNGDVTVTLPRSL